MNQSINEGRVRLRRRKGEREGRNKGRKSVMNERMQRGRVGGGKWEGAE